MINPILFFLCHFVGDYILQTPWMALNKYTHTLPCLIHVLIYTACFLVLTTSWKALLLIGISHFIIDRFPVIVRRIIWIKNHFPKMKYPPFIECDSTGYYDDSPYNTSRKNDTVTVGGVKFNSCYGSKRPEWWGKSTHFFISIWLYIVTDNTLHLIFNYVALSLL
jgi:hypothetical protein